MKVTFEGSKDEVAFFLMPTENIFMPPKKPDTFDPGMDHMKQAEESTDSWERPPGIWLNLEVYERLMECKVACVTMRRYWLRNGIDSVHVLEHDRRWPEGVRVWEAAERFMGNEGGDQ